MTGLFLAGCAVGGFMGFVGAFVLIRWVNK